MIRVTVWNEFIHEREMPDVAAIYPEGIHGAISSFLEARLGDEVAVCTATLDQPEHGLTAAVLEETDVLIWWGHMAHDQVSDDVVDRVQQRVLEGMGLIALHSAHASKIFQRLMGTGCMLRWRDSGEKEILRVVDPSHPIVHGIENEGFEIPRAEMYGEFFDVPPPDELILLSWFEGQEVFRSGCTWRRGAGRIFYFRPGHETFPIFHQKEVQLLICNGVLWAARKGTRYIGDAREVERKELKP
ncbi:MAG: ThuA domain-containing protein [Planctomycetota bacterium]